MPMGVRVLVTAGEHWGVLAAVRALHAAGHEPWLVAPGKRVYAARSRFVRGTAVAPYPQEDPDRFAQVVAATARASGARAVLPGTDAALLALAERRTVLPDGVALGAPDLEIVRRATAKDALVQLAAAAGLETPATTIVRAGDDVGALPLPAAVTPLRSLATPRRANTRDELVRALAELPGDAHAVQPWLDGQLAAVCGLAWEGRLVCCVHQVAHRIWPPDAGISAYAETVEPDHGVEEKVALLLADLGWSGLFQLQFLRTRAGDLPIDLNPRIYGSLALAVAAGLNLPALWLELLLGAAPPEPPAYRAGVRYRAEENDLRALARSGPLALARGLAPRPRTTHAVFSARDPAPLLTTLAKLRPRRLRSRPRRGSPV